MKEKKTQTQIVTKIRNSKSDNLKTPAVTKSKNSNYDYLTTQIVTKLEKKQSVTKLKTQILTELK